MAWPLRDNGTDVSNGGIRLMGIAIVAFAVVLLHLLVVLWPPKLPGAATASPPVPSNKSSSANEEAGTESQPTAQNSPDAGKEATSTSGVSTGTTSTDPEDYNRVVLFGWINGGVGLWILTEVRLMLLAVVAGGLGSLIHITSSFSDFVGNRSFRRSWLTWYILRPVVAMGLALLFYWVLRGGLITPGSGPNAVNVFGVCALSAMAGLFSKRAADKLEELFATLFKTDQDTQRRDKLSPHRPSIVGFDPPVLHAPAEGPVRLTVMGERFDTDAEVCFENKVYHPLETRTGNKLVVEIPQDQLQAPRSVDVSVRNPDARGGTSAPKTIEIKRNDPDPDPG